MVNFSIYSPSDLAASASQVTQPRDQPSYITDNEKTRRDWYVVRAAYFRPGVGGLYQTKLADQYYLPEKRTWTTSSDTGNAYYPAEMWGAWNPVPRIVRTDVAALMNEFEPEGIVVRNDETLTDLLHDVLNENGFYQFMQKGMMLSGALGDSYPLVRLDETKQFGISLSVYPGDAVYPILDAHTDREKAFKIYYKTNLIDDYPERNGAYVERTGVEVFHILTPSGQYVEVGGEFQADLSVDWNYNGCIPMVHWPMMTFDDYFGIASCDSILEDIDRINKCYTAIWMQFKRMMHPHTMSYGWTPESGYLKIGAPMHHSIPDANGRFEVVQFPIESTYLQALTQIMETVKEKQPHYSVFRQQSSMAAQAQETMQVRYGAFITYERMLETYWRDNIAKLCNTILRVLGKTDRDVVIDVDLGPPISPEVTQQLDQINREMEVLGDTEPVMDRALTALKYTPEEKDAIKQERTTAKEKEREKEEAAKTANVNPILARLQQRKMKRGMPIEKKEEAEEGEE